MGVTDIAVKVASQEVTYRDTVVFPAGIPLPTPDLGHVGPWYVFGLPRQFVWVRQTAGAVVGSLVVEWAIRDSATPGTPEWLPLQTIPIAVIGTAVGTVLTTGAVWLRFSVVGVTGDTFEVAGTAFV